MKRQLKTGNDFTGNNNIPEFEHEPLSGAKKTINGIGYLRFLVTGDAIQTVQPGSWIACYNDNSTTAWVAAGGPSLPVPSSAGVDSWPLPPKQWTLICVGPNNRARASSGVSMYLADDNTILS
jgi:hypothetical protein